MLVDSHQRAVRYLRLSLTERCNLACTYCVPEHHDELPADWMSDDEIVALVAALLPLGLDHVRLTGGEPTLRPRLPALVARLVALGITDLSLTTNGTRLSALAGALQKAGLHRMNVSLDTLDASAFHALTGGELASVLAGIEAASRFPHGKLNVVLLRGINDGKLAELARFAWHHGLVPRFIELMPMSDGQLAPSARFLSAAHARVELERELGPLVQSHHDRPGVGPARYVVSVEGSLGFISAVTEPFCSSCNRVRVSARGRLHTCLGIDDAPSRVDADPLDLRAAIRRGADATRDAVRVALAQKRSGHTFDPRATSAGGPRRHMVVIGG